MNYKSRKDSSEEARLEFLQELSIDCLAAIRDKLSPRVVKNAPKRDISSVESSSLNKIARELDKPIKFEPHKLLKHIKNTSYYYMKCIFLSSKLCI